MARPLYIGILSGTSLDAIDAICYDFSINQPTGFVSIPIDSELARQITALREDPANNLAQLMWLDRQLGERFGQAVNQLLQHCGLAPNQVVAIGSHGQTVLHHSNRQRAGYSLQIGDPNTIAEVTGIDTVADVRRRDIAAGGEGAPLAPILHRYLFASRSEARAIINLGGIANITWLGAGGDTTGFDCGPANALLDAHYSLHHSGRFDEGGQWAKQGKVDEKLLRFLLQACDYYQQTPPKSTGKEQFNLPYLKRVLSDYGQTVAAVDVQATLTELTVQTIAIGLSQCPAADHVYCCGGGTFNSFLMARLAQQLSVPVDSVEALGVAPSHVEAITMAYLAKQRVELAAGNVPMVTAAKGARILGGLYKA